MHLANKVTHIHSLLGSALRAESIEVMGAKSCRAIWGEFNPTESEEVDRAFAAATGVQPLH